MMRRIPLIPALFLLAANVLNAAPPGPAAPLTAPKPVVVDEIRIREHIDFLTSEQLAGRSGRGSRLAAEYLQQQFAELKLEPLFEDKYLQRIPGGKDRNTTAGQNVGAVLRGSDPALRDEYIIIAAHYDHLGRSGETMYPGADDNASGTAMLLETARLLSARREHLKRSVMFVGFDLEERLLWGSRWFVAHPPVPLNNIKCLLVADMIGRSLGGLDLSTVFVMGSEYSPQLRALLVNTKTPDALHVAQLGIDLIGVRSDYGPFWSEEVPFLFFSTGEHPDYHKPTDTAEKIRYPQVRMVTRLIYDLTEQLATASEAPAWSNDVEPSIEEVRAVRNIALRLLENQSMSNPLGPSQLLLLAHIKTQTASIIERGTMTSGERTWLIRVSQLLLFSVL